MQMKSNLDSHGFPGDFSVASIKGSLLSNRSKFIRRSQQSANSFTLLLQATTETLVGTDLANRHPAKNRGIGCPKKSMSGPGTLFFFLNGQKVLDEHVEPDQSVLQYLRLSTYRFLCIFAVCVSVTPIHHIELCFWSRAWSDRRQVGLQRRWLWCLHGFGVALRLDVEAHRQPFGECLLGPSVLH
jgi:hypothetical protein